MYSEFPASEYIFTPQVFNRSFSVSVKYVLPGKVLAILVHGHLGALELVELSSDGGLIPRSQPGPWLVGAPVVIMRLYITIPHKYITSVERRKC